MAPDRVRANLLFEPTRPAKTSCYLPGFSNGPQTETDHDPLKPPERLPESESRLLQHTDFGEDTLQRLRAFRVPFTGRSPSAAFELLYAATLASHFVGSPAANSSLAYAPPLYWQNMPNAVPPQRAKIRKLFLARPTATACPWYDNAFGKTPS